MSRLPGFSVYSSGRMTKLSTVWAVFAPYDDLLGIQDVGRVAICLAAGMFAFVVMRIEERIGEMRECCGVGD